MKKTVIDKLKLSIASALVAPFLMFSSVIAQDELVTISEFPITFEDETIDWDNVFVDFDGGATEVVDNPDPTGINTSDKVVQMVKGGGEIWGGSWFQMSEALDMDSSTEFTIKVWSPRADVPLLFKIENDDFPDQNHEIEQVIPVADEWVELTFDMSGADMANEYHKIVLIFDLADGQAGDGGSDFTWYFDDIDHVGVSNGEETETPIAGGIQFPVTFEEEDIVWEDEFNNFGGGELTLVDNPDQSGINTSAKVAQMVKTGDAFWGGGWFQMAEPIDLAASTEITIKVWSPRVNIDLLLKIENADFDDQFYETTEVIPVAEEWVELTFDMSEADMSNEYQRIVLIFDMEEGQEGDGGSDFTFYFDDINHASATSIDSRSDALPNKITLSQNYPNPFNPTTTIDFALPQSSTISLTVYNMLGQRVAVLADGQFNEGWHSVSFDAINLSSGMYIYRLQSENQVITNKMLLVK